MVKQRKPVKPQHKVNVSMKAWDIAKAGAAITLRVSNRNGHVGTIEIGRAAFVGERHTLRVSSASHGRSSRTRWTTSSASSRALEH